MAGQMHIATDDERTTMLAGLLRAKVRDLRVARDVERDAIRHCSARVRKIEGELRAAMSNAAMCGVEIEPEAPAPCDPLFVECTTPAYTRDAEPFTEDEVNRIVCGLTL